MQARRWLSIVSVIMTLILVVVILGCAPRAPTSHTTVTLEVMSSPSGTFPYVVAGAVADILNKHHPWLKATLEETKGAQAAIVISAEYPLERKKHVFFDFGFHVSQERAIKGVPPFEKPYPDLKIVRVPSAGGISIITYDTNIRTPGDLVGKKVGMFPLANPASWLGEELLRSWGISDKVKKEHMPPSQFKDALKTGLIDAARINWAASAPGKAGAPGYIRQIIGAGKWHTLPVTKADADKMKTKIAGEWGLITANSISPGLPPEDIQVFWAPSSSFMYDVADDEIVYELLKTLDEYAEEFGDYTPSLKGIVPSKSTEGFAGGILEKGIFHPGAIKYYEEQGIKF